MVRVDAIQLVLNPLRASPARGGRAPWTGSAAGAPLAGVWGCERGVGGRVERTVGAWDDVRQRLRLRLLMAAGRIWAGRG